MAIIDHPVKFVVRLTPEERTQLEWIIRNGQGAASRLLKARILLKADVSEDGSGWSDERISEALGTCCSKVLHTCRQLVEEGLDVALSLKKSAWSPPRILNGEVKAKLTTLACSEPPQGHTHWSLQLLGKRVVELGIVEAASDTDIFRVLRKNEVRSHKNLFWLIPPNANAGFVAAMEDLLVVYTDPRDPTCPLVCLDETSIQLTRETRTPLPGRGAWVDYEYERAGVACLFMLFAPLEGWRHVAVRERRTTIDYAHILRDLADVHFPSADKITLVQDSLDTYKPASLYEAFSLAEANRIVGRFEWLYTPRHGSWLNIAECELNVLTQQCFARRIPDRTALATVVEAWESTRNSVGSRCNWQFTIQDARTKLPHLYPVIE